MKQLSLKILIALFPLSGCLLLYGCGNDIFYIRKYEGSINGMESHIDSSSDGLLNSPDDILLHDTDGQEKNYAFTYAGASFQAIYTPDNWKVIDSYLITNSADIVMICDALQRVHPIHGVDMKSERTAKDMAYEWEQHNLAYSLLPYDSPYRANTKDVDLNPADQGKSAYEMYLERQG